MVWGEFRWSQWHQTPGMWRGWGLLDAFLAGGKIQGASSALEAALSPKFPSKFSPQYPNENEQQKGKRVFGLGSLKLPKKFININKGFVE